MAAVALIAAETLAVYPLRQIAPEISLGVVYLLGVLLVSSVWGLALGLVTAVLSTAAFDVFLVPPPLDFVPSDSHGLAALSILLSVALLLSVVAAVARTRAIEADQRRREADDRRVEADLAAAMARVLLRSGDLGSALPGVSVRLAQTLGLASASIELRAVAGGEQRAAFPLRDGGTPLGTLLLPAELSQETEVRVRERVVPAVEALLRAAREREAMGNALKISRDELRVLAEEQAALRRVATLVARGTSPEKVFAAVVEEVGRLLPVDLAHLGRYESETSMSVVAGWGRRGEHFPIGSRLTLGGENLNTLVFQTGRPARVDSYADATGELGVASRAAGIGSAVGTPIFVEGRLWGAMSAGSRQQQPLPAGTEARLADFTELLAVAIANAESHADLAASRARIVAAADESRRRIERDLHDGTQQQLVSLMLQLRTAQAAELSDADQLRAQLAQTADGLDGVLEALREISRGIHPAILSRGGLRPAIRALARRSAVPVELDLRAERRLPEYLEVAVYYVVSEALTNAAKHAQASVVNVQLHTHGEDLQVIISDDGIGGVDPSQGSGLVGLRDRIEALGGRLKVTSPAGQGTTLQIKIPLTHQNGALSL